MFKVSRPSTPPSCTKSSGYNTAEIVKILSKIFHGKCYLCEQIHLSDPEIEHLVPHEGDDKKKFDWNNLYYSCSRCNSIKGSKHKNILDCCDSNTEIFKSLQFSMPGHPDHNIRVNVVDCYKNKATHNTAALLERCYNEAATGLRGITRSNLIDKIFDHYCDLLILRQTIVNIKSTKGEIKLAKDKLAVMLESSFPFSAIWKWHLLQDEKLLDKTHDLILPYL